MLVGLLLAVLTVFLSLMIYMNILVFVSRRPKERMPRPVTLMVISSALGIAMMLSGLYFTGHLPFAYVT